MKKPSLAPLFVALACASTACQGYTPIGRPEQGDTETCWHVKWACRLAKSSPYFDDLQLELVLDPATGRLRLVYVVDYSDEALVSARGAGYAKVEEVEEGYWRQPEKVIAYRALRLLPRHSAEGKEHAAEVHGPGMSTLWKRLPPIKESLAATCIAPDWTYGCEPES